MVHRSKVSTFKGAYCINVRRFYIVLRVAGFILFFRNMSFKMWLNMIMER